MLRSHSLGRARGVAVVVVGACVVGTLPSACATGARALGDEPAGGAGGTAGTSTGGTAGHRDGGAGVGGAGAGGTGAGGSAGAGVDAAPDADAGRGGAPMDAATPDAPSADAPWEAGADADPCQGVTCASPPAPSCSGSDLVVAQSVGQCQGGSCTYTTSSVTCPNGCSGGACVGDPCLGMACDTPPSPTCASATHLTVHQSPGTCSAGVCSYATVQAFCPFGCVANVCNGDPCAGVSCTSPPANYCRNASYLVVAASPGTCAGSGTCTYTTMDVFCAFGCNGTQCQGDPCAGVSCTSPPAASCKDGSTARTYANPGTCSAGVCTYGETEVACAYGCVAGVCRQCQLDSHCPSGSYCSGGTCAACTTSQRCGASCTDCTVTGNICSAGQCVQCVGTGLCGAGQRCSSNVCVPCTTNANCGATCATCAAGSSCDGSVCVPCDTTTQCGAACAPCGGATPHCLAQGTSSQCVECLNDGHCPGEVCSPVTRTCGPACPPTLTAAFSDDFAAPNAAAWTSGTDVAITTSRWRAFTTAQHGVRIDAGRLEVTNKRGSSGVAHGHGYAYVKAGGAGSAYDNGLYQSTLSANVGKDVVWTLNMRRDNPETTNGGFSCSSTSSQNDITVGLAYVLATDSASGLNASASTCSASATSRGYAVVIGGSARVRLVRFVNGLRNGTLTDIVTSGTFTVSNYFSVRVTYKPSINDWQLEVRSDGTSAFTNPLAGGAYGFTGNAVDATHVNLALDYAGPYFQTGCTGLCSSTYLARFDNVSVGVRCGG